MPCVRNLSVSHALQYFDDDVKKKQIKGLDYYSQEDSGIWFGNIAEKFGFTNKKFTRNDYHQVMKGKFSYFDKDLGKTVDIDLTKKSKNGEHHAGIELTLSAPKTVSIVAEVFKDNRVRDAHSNAVRRVVEYIQDNMCYTRTSQSGKMALEKVNNLLAVKFTHHTNRNHDPQLHDHILITNISVDKNGKIKTAEHSTIFENERFIRELYNNELAHNLQILGYDIEWNKKVTQVSPEIKNIPEPLTRMFSSRRQEIEKLATDRDIDLSDQVAMQNITLETRKAKDNSIDLDKLSILWKEKVSELNINIEQIKKELFAKNLENQNKTQLYDYNLLTEFANNSINHLTERNAAFTKEDLISNVILRSGGLFGIDEIEKAMSTNNELVSNEVKMKEYSKHLRIYNDRGKSIYTTKSQIATENRIISAINKGANKFAAIYSKEEINNFSSQQKSIDKDLNKLLFGDIVDDKGSNLYSTLNDSQKHTVDFILQSKDQFLGIQGYAGVGKTYTIKALNEKLAAKGYEILGFAPTNSAAVTLFEESGIKTNTLQSFLLKYNGYANDRNGNVEVLKTIKNSFKNKIILVDEASLISNTQMKELVVIAEKFGTRVIMQGDIKQLGSVEAGSPFELLIKNKFIEYDILKNIQRQRDQELKNTVLDIVNKDIKQAFDRLKNYSKDKQISKVVELRTDEKLIDDVKNGNHKLSKLKEELVEASVKEYMNFNNSNDNNNKTIIVTSSNEIRKKINEKLRTCLKEASPNTIENKKITIETLEIKSLTAQEKKERNNYNLGDTIIFLKSNNVNGIEKNTDYKIVNVDKNLKNNEIIITDGKKEINIDITKHYKNINLYEKVDKELVPNDKIKWTVTDKEKGIIKGSDLIIKDISIDTNTITIVDVKKNKEIIMNLNNDKNILKHIDYNYVTTTYSAQGKTSKNVIFTLESYRPNLTTQKEFYVGISRTKDNVVVITDNVNASIQTLTKNSGEKLTATDLDFSNGANQINGSESKNVNNYNKAKDDGLEFD